MGDGLLRDGLWTTVTPSEHDHEREALNWLRAQLPDREPYRAWSNFTFLDHDGGLNEVDALVVGPTGVYLVEVKSHPGKMEGDFGSWTWTRPDGRRKTFDNPLPLADTKAKKLKSLLLHQRAFTTKPELRRRGFFLRAVVFLSDPDLTCMLDPTGRAHVYGRDRGDRPSRSHDLPGMAKLLTEVSPDARTTVNRPLAQTIAQAMAQAGLRESTAHRRVGPYELGELLAEGEGWQDRVAEHADVRGETARIRIYLTGRATTPEERDTLARAAKREYHLLRNVDHPGVAVARLYQETDRGPALVFDHDPQAQRLDHWLTDHGDQLDLLSRIDLVRQLAETLGYAHRKGLYHRALAPQHVKVTTAGDGSLQLRIADWQAGVRAITSTTQLSAGTRHVTRLIAEPAQIYLAPEVTTVPDARPRPADVYGLGAVSVLILSGRPPAADTAGIQTALREQGCLSLSMVLDAAPEDLDAMIRFATAKEALDRLTSVEEFLEYLDFALEALTAPELADPLEAKKGDDLPGGWTVVRRLGTGSTSVVLLAERDGAEEVLKVARTPERADTLRAEFDVLDRLRDRHVIQVYGTTQLGTHLALRLEPADRTLAEDLTRDGKLSLDMLERYGGDLLRAVVTLEAEGVSHRDVKPENLGVVVRGKNKERRLALLDFSLSRASPTDLDVGTQGYRDPFMAEQQRHRYDPAADRYAVAVTLHEMATAVRPRWGDGSTSPELTDDDVPHVAADAIDEPVRASLASFLERALHRDVRQRFDTADEMLRGFQRVFEQLDVAAGDAPSGGRSADEVALGDATPDTTVAALGLSPRLHSALDRLGIATLRDLAAVPAATINHTGGIGAEARREVAHLARRVRDEVVTASLGSEFGPPSVDRLTDVAVPQPPADHDQRIVIRSLLALDPEPSSDWPTQREVSIRTTLSREAVAEAVIARRQRWLDRPEVTQVRAQLLDLLVARGGVAAGDELADALLATRGSQAIGGERLRRARAVIRAAAEAEAALTEPRLVLRRLGNRVVLALNTILEVNGEEVLFVAADLTEAAARLGEAAEEVAARDPLVPTEQVVAALRAVELPEDVGPFTDARLARLAAGASQHAAVSSRLELYPAGMPPLRSLREARSALLERRGLTVEEVRQRVRARFPAAAELPGRPDLDRLLEQADTGLAWRADDSGDARYRLAGIGGPLSTYYASDSSGTFATPADRDRTLRDLDARLRRLRDEGGFLALTVDARAYRGAPQALADHLGAPAIDLNRRVVATMQQRAQAANAQWSRLLQADAAGAGARHFGVVKDLARQAIDEAIDELVASERVVVLHDLGLLVRYGLMHVVEELRDRLTRGPGEHVLAAAVVVVPTDDPKAKPTLDGQPVPVLTANQWGYLPRAWLDRDQEPAA